MESLEFKTKNKETKDNNINKLNLNLDYLDSIDYF